jgi:hypothetical protein
VVSTALHNDTRRGRSFGVGLSPLGGDTIVALSPFDDWLVEAFNEIVNEPIAKAYLTGWIGCEIALFLAMHGGHPGFVIGLSASIIAKEVLFQLASTDSTGLWGSFVGALFSWAYGFLATLAQLARLGIATLADFLEISGKLDYWKLFFKFIYIPRNIFYLIRTIDRLVELDAL